MKDGGCPFSLGTHDRLNDAGEHMMIMMRTGTSNKLDINKGGPNMEWKTWNGGRSETWTRSAFLR
jgi:hypothetical protein